MRLLAYDKNTDSYALTDVDISTLEDTRKLSGSATVLRAGLALTLDYGKGSVNWDQKDGPVSFTATEQGGVLIPDSFDSLAMASIYYNMELSYLFFCDEMGIDGATLRRLPTYYKPKIVIKENEKEPYQMMDNAFYMQISDTERGFFIVPFEIFQWVPIALNTGILTHEYTHYVFDILFKDNIPTLDAKSENFLRAFNEATADFMAVARTEDPDFMAPSIPPTLFVAEKCNGLSGMELSRDISDPITQNYNSIMDYWAREIEDTNAFCPYEIGLLLAGIFYEIAIGLDEVNGDIEDTPSKESLILVAGRLMDTLDGLAESVSKTEDFELWDMFSELVAQFDNNTERAVVCSVIEARYEIYFSEVIGC